VKDDFYTLHSLVEDSEQYGRWDEAEWGFPKGRRNFQEKDFDCAVREFCEETGFKSEDLIPVQNIFPYEEIFTGSNYKSYKHKYFLMYMDFENTLEMGNYERAEVSKIDWYSFEECMSLMRDYNLEKKKLLENVHRCLVGN
jgi:8-oxo-dGTP pyrophosphatase MutT (NUDIX family)